MEAYIDPVLTYADFSWCDTESDTSAGKCKCPEGKSVFYAAKDVAWIVEQSSSPWETSIIPWDSAWNSPIGFQPANDPGGKADTKL